MIEVSTEYKHTTPGGFSGEVIHVNDEYYAALIPFSGTKVIVGIGAYTEAALCDADARWEEWRVGSTEDRANYIAELEAERDALIEDYSIQEEKICDLQAVVADLEMQLEELETLLFDCESRRDIL